MKDERLNQYTINIYEYELQDLLLILEKSDSHNAGYLYDIVFDAWLHNRVNKKKNGKKCVHSST